MTLSKTGNLTLGGTLSTTALTATNASTINIGTGTPGQITIGNTASTTPVLVGGCLLGNNTLSGSTPLSNFNICDEQTSGTLYLGSNASRSGAINIGVTGTGQTNEINIGKGTSGQITIGNTASTNLVSVAGCLLGTLSSDSKIRGNTPGANVNICDDQTSGTLDIGTIGDIS
jgi:hypothetical protein